MVRENRAGMREAGQRPGEGWRKQVDWRERVQSWSPKDLKNVDQEQSSGGQACPHRHRAGAGIPRQCSSQGNSSRCPAVFLVSDPFLNFHFWSPVFRIH